MASTLARAMGRIRATTQAKPPTTKNGNLKPPASNRRDPRAGPIISPRPKDVSVRAIVLATLSGNIWRRSDKTALQQAASAIPVSPLKDRAVQGQFVSIPFE